MKICVIFHKKGIIMRKKTEAQEIATVKAKTQDLMDYIFSSSNPQFHLDTVTILIEMAFRKFLREKGKLCKECKK